MSCVAMTKDCGVVILMLWLYIMQIAINNNCYYLSYCGG